MLFVFKNYARGHYTIGKELIDVCMDRIRREDSSMVIENMIIANCLKDRQSIAMLSKVFSFSTRSVVEPALGLPL